MKKADMKKFARHFNWFKSDFMNMDTFKHAQGELTPATYILNFELSGTDKGYLHVELFRTDATITENGHAAKFYMTVDKYEANGNWREIIYCNVFAEMFSRGEIALTFEIYETNVYKQEYLEIFSEIAKLPMAQIRVKHANMYPDGRKYFTED